MKIKNYKTIKPFHYCYCIFTVFLATGVLGMQRVINEYGDAITNVSVFVLENNASLGDYYYTFNIVGNFKFNDSNNETSLVSIDQLKG